MTAKELWNKSEEYLLSFFSDIWHEELRREILRRELAERKEKEQEFRATFPGEWLKHFGDVKSLEIDDQRFSEFVLMKMRTAYLFPQLTESQRGLLLGAWMGARGIDEAVKMNPVSEEEVAHMERTFVDLRSKVATLPIAEIQLEILNKHYLMVHFD